MKKSIFKFTSLVLFSLVALTGCEEEVVKYNSNNSNGVAAFRSTNQDLPVNEVGESSILVTVDVSNVSDVDRTISVSVDPESTADASSYEIVNSTLTVPAGENNGYIEIKGNFDNIPSLVTWTLILNLEGVDEAVLDNQKNQTTINLYRVCPVPDGFLTGDYLLEEQTPFVDGPTLEDGAVRTITVDPADPNKRVFTTYTFPDYCSSSRVSFSFSLICGEVVSATNQGNCVCTAGAPYVFGPAETNGTYDVADDSVVYLAFTNDVTSNCSAPVQTVYKLTKQ